MRSNENTHPTGRPYDEWGWKKNSHHLRKGVQEMKRKGIAP